MKELLVQLAAYNVWANGVLAETILALSEEQQAREVKSSFTSLFKTILHIWDAESIWWQRMKLSERINRPSEHFEGTIQQAITGLDLQSKQWLEWIESVQEHQYQHEFIYYNPKKENFKQAVYQMLLHLFNHGTYHRGQIVTVLRQLEVEKIPATDFIVWSRKK